jgi:hypothetical protein
MTRTARRLLSFGVMLAGLAADAAGADEYQFETSDYWCAKLDGIMQGNTCSATYVPDSNPCDKFERLNPDDAKMMQTIGQVRQSSVCISDTVNEAKSHTLRLRADLMGYVSAGRDETVNDPTSPNSGDMVSRAQNGSAPYWPLASYYLYQCVVDVCESK